MSYFRNPEIKKTIGLYIIFTILFVPIGLSLSLETGILVGILCAVFTVSHLLLVKSRYDKMSELSLEIDRILHGYDSINLTNYSEGELAILQNTINKLMVRLREQNDCLQKEKVYLADSLADITHQLRTPLTSINIIVSLLGKESDSLRRMEMINELTLHLSRIDWLVTALLRISKIDADMVTFQQEEVKVTDLIKKAIEPLAIPMDLRDQRLFVNVEGEVSYVGDFAWSVEAVTNVIKNCMEHTPTGGEITISSNDNTIFTELIISDNGRGIEQEDLPYLFDRFYKGKNSSDQSVGIGLALARMIFTKQNGVIKAENNKDQGARFIIKIYKKAV